MKTSPPFLRSPILFFSLLFIIISCSTADVVETLSTDVTISDCPTSASAVTAPAGDSAVATWTEPTAVYDNGVAVAIATQSHSPGDSFPLGDTEVTYTFTDDAGSAPATCTFTVTVSQPVSTGVTIVSCPTNIRVSVSGTETFAVATWTEPTAVYDNGVAVAIATQSHSPGDSFPLGDTEVTYTFTDDTGNSKTCTFTVTVSQPSSTGVTISDCPANVTKVTAPAETTVAVSWTPPTATDSNGKSLTATASHSPGDSFPLGDTEVTYTFTDDAGNTGTCTFTVTVSQPVSTGVTIVSCPTNIRVSVSGTETFAVATWTEPTAVYDNGVAVAIATQSHSPGDSFPLGDTEVTYLFTDDTGNSKTCTFTVTVSQPSSTGVTISDCPANVTKVTAPAGDSAVATWTPPTATDSNGKSLTATASHSPGDSFPLGDTEVTYTFTDDTGNSKTCTFTVTVSQPSSTGVTISDCPANVTKVTAPAETTVAVSWTPPTATDSNGKSLTATASHSPGDSFPLGDTEVTYTFTDDAGNTGTCTFTVTVSQPVSTGVTIVSCPTNIRVSVSGTETFAVATWTDPTAIDSNGNPVTSMSATQDSGTAFALGETEVSVTITDAAGNSDTSCRFIVGIYFYHFDLANPTAAPALTNAFLIKTSAELTLLATVVNDESTYMLSGTDTRYAAGSYRLESSLDLAGTTHTPIGDCKSGPTNVYPYSACGDSDDIAFTGTFDGNGKILTNLSYNGDNGSLGLFSVTDGAIISDLTLSNPSMTNITTDNSHITGALVGYSENSELSNVSVIGGTIQGRNFVGGLVGLLPSGAIIESDVTGDVSGNENIGGLVGWVGSGGTISGSYATGDVMGTQRIGGFVGDQRGTVTGSYATGTVTGTNDFIGGLIGVLVGTVTGSYATGATTGKSSIGGLSGWMGSVGGVTAVITASYATGAVSGTANPIGGLIGKFVSGTITNSYWDKQTTGQTSSAGSSDSDGKTTAQLQILGGPGTIYATWTTPPWVFMVGAYPTLSP